MLAPRVISCVTQSACPPSTASFNADLPAASPESIPTCETARFCSSSSSASALPPAAAMCRAVRPPCSVAISAVHSPLALVGAWASMLSRCARHAARSAASSRSAPRCTVTSGGAAEPSRKLRVSYFLRMCPSRCAAVASAPASAGAAPRWGSQMSLTAVLPRATIMKRSGSDHSLTSSSSERTLEMCTPICRWTPEQAKHTTTPRLIDAHDGLDAPQSAHCWLPSARMILPHTDAEPETELIRGVRTAQPSDEAVAFWMTSTHSATSSDDCACSAIVCCGEITSKTYGTLSWRASRTLTVARGREMDDAAFEGTGSASSQSNDGEPGLLPPPLPQPPPASLATIRSLAERLREMVGVSVIRSES
mmetsp:Transcript_54069/g.139659  ORF Transcript_54069/g.139659 Transcript_54069/m.139659 type:complete len:365 (+) Transcript_54069:603-1697(+)